MIVKYWLHFDPAGIGRDLAERRRSRHMQVLCIVDNIIPHEKRPGDKQFTNYFIKACRFGLICDHEQGCAEGCEDISTQAEPTLPRILFTTVQSGSEQAGSMQQTGVGWKQEIRFVFRFRFANTGSACCLRLWRIGGEEAGSRIDSQP